MPLMALDILPASIDAGSLAGIDAGIEAQGKSIGKNEGPSFSEMLDKASQDNTTDGKNTAVKTEPQEKAADEQPVAEKLSEKTVDADDADTVPETATPVVSYPEMKEVPVFSNQQIQTEKNVLESNPQTEESSVEMEVPLQAVPENAEEILSADGALGGKTAEITEAVETSENTVSLKKSNEVAFKSSETQNENLAQTGTDNASVQIKAADQAFADVHALKEMPASETKPAVSSVQTEAPSMVQLSDKSEEPAEIREAKKEKKSRFADYNSMMAMISGKENAAEAPDAAVRNGTEINLEAASAMGISGEEGKIQIVDLRTAQSQDDSSESGFSKQVTFDGKGSADISMTLNEGSVSSAMKNGTVAEGEGISKADFGNMLAKELENSAQDLVKTGSVVLQDNNKGTINLILHPEELGNVKIKLELSENQISGRILVASQEAYDAFKDNINVIKEAFAAGGFETSGFELAWNGSGNGGNTDQQKDRQYQSDDQDTVNIYGVKYADSMPDAVPENHVGSGNVNLVA